MNLRTRTLAALSATLSCSALAIEPQGIPLGEMMAFTPTIDVSGRYDDNFRAVEKGAESSFISRLSPAFVLSMEGAKSAYQLKYRADVDTFLSSAKDNNTDQHLALDAGYEFDTRNRLLLDAGFHKVEDTESQEQHLQNDRYTTTNAGGVYTYGARTARTQVDLAADYEQLRYQNTEHLNAERERNTTALRSTVYYAIAPKTKLLLEGRHSVFDYLSNDNLDSSNAALLGGLVWDATAKTSGTLRVGGERKSFDHGSQDSLKGSLWEVGATWKPRTYSTFGVKTRRGLDEGYFGATAIKAQSTTLSWEHQWVERFGSELSYTRSSNKYHSIDREDKIDQFGIGSTYKMYRWLDLKAGYKYVKDDSSYAGQSYRRNVFEIGFTAGL